MSDTPDSANFVMPIGKWFAIKKHLRDYADLAETEADKIRKDTANLWRDRLSRALQDLSKELHKMADD